MAVACVQTGPRARWSPSLLCCEVGEGVVEYRVHGIVFCSVQGVELCEQQQRELLVMYGRVWNCVRGAYIVLWGV